MIRIITARGRRHRGIALHRQPADRPEEFPPGGNRRVGQAPYSNTVHCDSTTKNLGVTRRLSGECHKGCPFNKTVRGVKSALRSAGGDLHALVREYALTSPDGTGSDRVPSCRNWGHQFRRAIHNFVSSKAALLGGLRDLWACTLTTT